MVIGTCCDGSSEIATTVVYQSLLRVARQPRPRQGLGRQPARLEDVSRRGARRPLDRLTAPQSNWVRGSPTQPPSTWPFPPAGALIQINRVIAFLAYHAPSGGEGVTREKDDV